LLLSATHWAPFEHGVGEQTKYKSSDQCVTSRNDNKTIEYSIKNYSNLLEYFSVYYLLSTPETIDIVQKAAQIRNGSSHCIVGYNKIFS